jgi:hypothetical protein
MPQQGKKPSERESSNVRGTKAGEMPDPNAAKRGETEDRVRDAFSGRPVILPEPKGDLADRAFADQEAELDEQIARAKRGKKGR